MKGFEIICRSCGVKMIIQPGNRDREKEPIGFGTERIFEVEYMGCRCGNAIESENHWESENEEDTGTLIERWVDVSRKTVDESAVFGNDCPKGVCEF